jgi:hypothetical protein
MANGYRVWIDSIASDGTNLYLEVRIQLGATTFPTIRPVFPVGTSAADLTTYIQTIADNGPTLTSALAELVGSSVKGA